MVKLESMVTDFNVSENSTLLFWAKALLKKHMLNTPKIEKEKRVITQVYIDCFAKEIFFKIFIKSQNHSKHYMFRLL